MLKYVKNRVIKFYYNEGDQFHNIKKSGLVLPEERMESSGLCRYELLQQP